MTKLSDDELKEWGELVEYLRATKQYARTTIKGGSFIVKPIRGRKPKRIVVNGLVRFV